MGIHEDFQASLQEAHRRLAARPIPLTLSGVRPSLHITSLDPFTYEHYIPLVRPAHKLNGTVDLLGLAYKPTDDSEKVFPYYIVGAQGEMHGKRADFKNITTFFLALNLPEPDYLYL